MKRGFLRTTLAALAAVVSLSLAAAPAQAEIRIDINQGVIAADADRDHRLPR